MKVQMMTLKLFGPNLCIYIVHLGEKNILMKLLNCWWLQISKFIIFKEKKTSKRKKFCGESTIKTKIVSIYRYGSSMCDPVLFLLRTINSKQIV